MSPKIQILYEDADVVALNKPANVLFDWALAEYPNFIPAHRLDKETSGVILFAKNQKAHEFLKRQFQNRSIKKKYLALVWGKPKRERGIIDTPIGRSKKDARKRRAGRGAASKLREALTEYRVLKNLNLPQTPTLIREGGKVISPPDKGDLGGLKCKEFSLLEIYPRTGRTHQIRVHLASIGHSVVGDKLYAPGRLVPAGVDRLALHAASIKFRNLAGKEIKIEAPLPPELERAFRIA